MTSISKTSTILTEALCVAFWALPGFAQEAFDPSSPMNANATTGPQIGETIPHFQAPDQHGVVRTFDDITGPNGALVMFHRSADW